VAGAVTPPTVPLGGKYKLLVYGISSPELSFDASAAVVENALNVMFNASASELVSVTDLGPFSGEEKVQYKVTFNAVLGHVPLLRVADGTLTGSSAAAQVQNVQMGTVPALSGFTLQVHTFGTTPTLPHDASAKQVEHAIETLGISATLDVHVSRVTLLPATTLWTITFPETFHSGTFTTTTMVQESTADGVPDSYTVGVTVVEQGTYKSMSGNFYLGLGDIAASASPAVTPVSTINNLGEASEGKIGTLSPLTLSWDSTALQMQTALSTLPNVKHVEVTRTTPKVQEGDTVKYAGYVWSITFISYGTHRHQGAVPLLTSSYTNTPNHYRETTCSWMLKCYRRRMVLQFH
jgi:hypothetical protein